MEKEEMHPPLGSGAGGSATVAQPTETYRKQWLIAKHCQSCVWSGSCPAVRSSHTILPSHLQANAHHQRQPLLLAKLLTQPGASLRL